MTSKQGIMYIFMLSTKVKDFMSNVSISPLTMSCSGKNWVKIDQLPVAPAPTSTSEGRDMELKGKSPDTTCSQTRNDYEEMG